MGPAINDGANGAREAGARVEALLAELRARSGPEAAGAAEELVTCLVRLYGAGLESIMRTIGDDSRLQALLIADPLVESVLLAHDLHPLDASARIRRALGRLGTGAEFLGVDSDGVPGPHRHLLFIGRRAAGEMARVRRRGRGEAHPRGAARRPPRALPPA
jgi:hypothetical protein